jgi:hypothetical protein
MFNNWKNGVLVDKESRFKTLACLVLGAELVLSISGAFVFSHSFVSLEDITIFPPLNIIQAFKFF